MSKHSAVLPNRRRSRSRAVAACALATIAAVVVTACTREVPLPIREPTATSFGVIAAPPVERVQAGEARRGVGWYPDVEVDAKDRVHVAYTDADLGDVMYAVSAPGAVTPSSVEPVETSGAAGAFVRLALAPGGAPIVSYYHQDEHSLRVAHRPRDVVAMKAAGADVDEVPAPDSAAKPGAPGWVLEDIAYGDEAGQGSALVIDDDGRPHLAYYVKGDRLRYARRPATAKAFGGSGVGYWQKLDVDKVGPSPLLITSMVVLPSSPSSAPAAVDAGAAAAGARTNESTVALSYCDWQIVMGHHKLALRRGETPFVVVPALAEPRSGIDGASTAIFTRAAGGTIVDVASARIDDGSLVVGALDVAAPAPFVERTRVARVHGPTVARRAADGTLWILTRDPRPVDDVANGLFLIELPRAVAADARRWQLDKGAQTDAWIDLALRPDGRPVAVWFSEDGKQLKVYAP